MEEGYIGSDLLNEEMCEDKHGHYHHAKWIDCYCKPEDHIGNAIQSFWPKNDDILIFQGWVASMSVIGTLFVVIKFILYYAGKYKAYKSAEKELEKVKYHFNSTLLVLFCTYSYIFGPRIVGNQFSLNVDVRKLDSKPPLTVKQVTFLP